MNEWDRLAEIIVELVGPTNPEQREELHRESHGLLRTLRERYEGECVWMQDPLDPGCQKTSCGHFIFMTREKMKHRIVDCNETRCPSCGKPIVEVGDEEK